VIGCGGVERKKRGGREGGEKDREKEARGVLAELGEGIMEFLIILMNMGWKFTY
jgi:hypothetical protein